MSWLKGSIIIVFLLNILLLIWGDRPDLSARPLARKIFKISDLVGLFTALILIIWYL